MKPDTTRPLPGTEPGGTTAQPLNIIELRAENFKRLSAVAIRPDGSMITISGRNEQGKTSVLDAITVALAGKEYAPKQPVRKGAKDAAVQVTLNNGMVVTRTFTLDGGGRLVVEYADKSRPKSPQAVLDELWSTLAIDPIAFMRKQAKDKFDTLKKLVPGVDFDAIEAANKADAEERTVIGRRQREQQGAADAISVPPGTPVQKVDEEGLIEQLNGAAAFNTQIGARRQKRRQAQVDLESTLNDAAKLRQDAAKMIGEAEGLESKARELSDKIDGAEPLPTEKDTEALTTALRNARTVNFDVSKLQQRERYLAQAKDAEDEYEQLTAAIAARTQKKIDAIAAAKMPIPGLGLGDGFVTLNDVPIEDASGAQQLRAATAIAMALNPKLRVILIRDGSLLDSESMKALGEIAAANSFQVFVERVTDGEGTGIIIEDGRVAS